MMRYSGGPRFLLTAAILAAVFTTVRVFAADLGIVWSQVQTVTETDNSNQLIPVYIEVWYRPMETGNVSFDYTVNAPAGVISPVSGTLNFTPNSRNTTINLMLGYDDIPEADADITITFRNSLTGSGTYSLTRVLDDDRRSLTVSGGTVQEGDSGSVTLPFTITMSEPLSTNFEFDFIASAGTATGGEDYVPLSGRINIPAGQTSAAVNLIVTGDDDVEFDETVGLNLTGFSLPVGTVTQTMGTVVTEDFAPGPVPGATVVTEAPGNDTAQAWFSVGLPAARTTSFSCRVSTRNGTALAGSDYRALPPTTITFAPGETRKWVAITVTSGPQPESREQFFLDVEALDSHEVTSAACAIEPLAITEFRRSSPGIYVLRFPTGLGQRYIVDEAPAPDAAWNPASSLLAGTGSPVPHLVFSDSIRMFFRVRTGPALPPGTPAAES